MVELARVITPENRGEVVARFCHASKREAKAISAELCPAEAAPRREMVTLLQPAPAARTQSVEVPRFVTHVRGSYRVPAAVVHPDLMIRHISGSVVAETVACGRRISARRSVESDRRRAG